MKPIKLTILPASNKRCVQMKKQYREYFNDFENDMYWPSHEYKQEAIRHGMFIMWGKKANWRQKEMP